MPSASYFFNAVSYTKDADQFTQGEIDKDYTPFVVNKMVSQYRELVLLADEMNIRRNISKEDQLHFYMVTIPKNKRRALWSTKAKNEDLDVVMEYYNITHEKADPYMKILTGDQIQELKERLNKGGRG